MGDLVSMEDWTGGNTFEVDLLNRITKVTDHKGKVVSYGYSGSATGAEVLTSAVYSDGDQVSSWARESVAALCAAGILQGTSEPPSPKDTTTVEQAILLTLRAYQLFKT